MNPQQQAFNELGTISDEHDLVYLDQVLEDPSLLSAVLQHKHCLPKSWLSQPGYAKLNDLLVSTKSEAIDQRYFVASREDLPIELMHVLATDVVDGVRARLASNTSLPLELFEALAADGKQVVRHAIAGNAKAPVPVLEGLVADKSIGVLTQLAVHPSVPVTVLEVLAKHPSWEVRYAVAGCKRTPEPVRRVLLKDPVALVRINARRS